SCQQAGLEAGLQQALLQQAGLQQVLLPAMPRPAIAQAAPDRLLPLGPPASVPPRRTRTARTPVRGRVPLRSKSEIPQRIFGRKSAVTEARRNGGGESG